MQGLDFSKGDHIAIDGRPYRVIEVSFHEDDNGDSFVDLVGVDIFTNKVSRHRSLPTDEFDIPEILRQDWQLVNIDDGYLNLMSSDGTTNDDVEIPEGDLGTQIKELFDQGRDLAITIQSTMGMQGAVGVHIG